MNQESNHLTKIEWESLISEQEKSGLSQAKFCKEKNIDISKFGYHRGLIKAKNKTKDEKDAPSLFSPVKVINKEQNLSSEIRLSLPNGFQCVFSIYSDAMQIKKIIAMLLSC
jgi:hypothetical protein